MSWTHKGIAIELMEVSGSFSAIIGGKRQVAPSLDAIKKRIDDAAKIGFEPFKALEYGRDDKITVYEVTGITRVTRGRRWGSSGERFITTASYSPERSSVTPDTLEARQAVKAWQALSKKNNAEIDRLKKAMEKAQKAIPVVSASAYTK